jgi:hypothetical protein
MKGQIYVVAAVPPTPVILEGADGTAFPIEKVLVIMAPLHPVMVTATVPDVKVEVNLIFTLLELRFKLKPIVDVLETVQE